MDCRKCYRLLARTDELPHTSGDGVHNWMHAESQESFPVTERMSAALCTFAHLVAPPKTTPTTVHRLMHANRLTSVWDPVGRMSPAQTRTLGLLAKGNV